MVRGHAKEAAQVRKAYDTFLRMARTNILQNTQNIHLAKTRERASKEEESALHERTGYKGGLGGCTS